MKICIVGGGSAGWMTATTLVRLLEDDITLVESPSINTIGVGESTLGHIRDWIDLVGIRDSENDFIREKKEPDKRIVEIKNNISKDLNIYSISLPSKYKDISEFYESGENNIENLISDKKDLVEFCIDDLIDKEGEANKKKIFSAYKKFSNYLSQLEKDLSLEYLGKKLGINKETLVNELSFKEDLITTTINQSENVQENKHIETFKDIFISNLSSFY